MAAANGHVAAVYDEYGATAFALCVAITKDRALTEDIILRCCRRAPPHPAREGGVWLLQSVRLQAVRSVRLDDEVPPPWFDAAEVLDGRQRQVLALVYLRGLSTTDVAAHLGLTPRETRTALAAAMNRLRHPGDANANGNSTVRSSTDRVPIQDGHPT
jgi:DNA-directed RNA polymerase specialized sigma24 family protein